MWGRSRQAVAPHGTCGGAGQGLLVAAVVDEGHSDLDGLALVGVYELVGRVGRLLYIRIGCSVTGYPLVGERFAAQTVGVGNARYARRQRLSHLCRATDGGRAGRRGVPTLIIGLSQCNALSERGGQEQRQPNRHENGGYECQASDSRLICHALLHLRCKVGVDAWCSRTPARNTPGSGGALVEGCFG